MENTKEILLSADYYIFTYEDFGFSREFGKFPYLNFYASVEGKIIRITDRNNPYYSKKKNAYRLDIWGTDRCFELLYSFSLLYNIPEIQKKNYFLI